MKVEYYCVGVIPRRIQVTPEYVVGSNGRDLYLISCWYGAEIAYFDNRVTNEITVKGGKILQWKK